MFSPFEKGFSFARKTVEFLGATVSIYNFIVVKFSLSLSTITEPIVLAYRKLAAILIDTIGAKYAWAIPDWNTDRIILTAVSASLITRIQIAGFLPNNEETDSWENEVQETNKYVVSFAKFLAPLLMIALAVFTPNIRTVFGPLVLFSLFGLSFLGFVDKNYRNATVYFWGAVLGASAALLYDWLENIGNE